LKYFHFLVVSDIDLEVGLYEKVRKVKKCALIIKTFREDGEE